MADDEFVPRKQVNWALDPLRLFSDVQPVRFRDDNLQVVTSPIAQAASLALVAATEAANVLLRQVEHFQSLLKPNEEIGLYVVGGPAGTTFFPTKITAVDPDKIIFTGQDQHDRPFTVIQHVTQLNFAIQAVPVEPDHVPRRIGFDI